MGEEEYEIPTDQAILLSKYLTEAWDKLGKPNDLFTESGRKLMTVIIAAWEDTYPTQYAQWKANRDEHLASELPIREQALHTGRSLSSTPTFVWYLMKKFYTGNNINERKFQLKFVKEYPIFRYTQRI